MILLPYENIDPELYTYILPEDRIASFPCKNREDSLLLVRKRNGTILTDVFSHLADHLEEGTTLVLNDSCVIPARLIFTKSTGAQIELFCLSPVHPSDYTLSLSSVTSCEWECMAGNLKRFNTSRLEMKIMLGERPLQLKAEKLHSKGNIVNVRFSWDLPSVTFADILASAGIVPLPPYIKRSPVESDRERYQTVYSRHKGSVAAPTAGLHFTGTVFQELERRNIQVRSVTLHVGAGTFQPIKSRSVGQHEMHAEYFRVSREFIQYLAGQKRNITAVGTTSVRTLESLYWLGVKIHENGSLPPEQLWLNQWEAYRLPQHVSTDKSFSALLQWMEKEYISELVTHTRLMIVPGYTFRSVQSMITNFHQPGSTLLLLVAAFMGDSWKSTYQYALDNSFRFLSYGDSSLLLG